MAICATRTFSFAPSTSQIVCAPRWYTFLPGGCLRVHFFYEHTRMRLWVCQCVYPTRVPWERVTGTHHMHLPRGAVSHVLETPIANPQDAAHVLAVDRTCKEVHRTSMSDCVFAFTVRERVRREVPVAGGGGETHGHII